MKKITLVAAVIAAMVGGNAYAQAEFDFSKATNYHLLYLDEETYGANNVAANVTSDCRPDDMTRFLYIWEGTYVGNTSAGVNSNGVPGAFMSFTVANVGWSGLGIVNNGGCHFDAIDDTYHFHLAIKTLDSDPQVIIVGDEDAKAVAKFTLGKTPFNDNGKIYEVLQEITTDGEWNAVDVSVADLKAYSETGNVGYPNPDFTGNVFAMLSGGREGTTVDLDAIFFYKPVDGAVKGVKDGKVQIISSNKTISVIGGAGIEVYDITGKLVKATSNSIVGTESLAAGVYVVKSGNTVSKVVVR